MTQPQQPPVTPNSMPGANPQMGQPVSTEPPAPPQETPKETAPQAPSQEPAKAPEGDKKPDEPTDWKTHARTWEERATENKRIADENAEAAKQWEAHQATLRTKEENDKIAIAKQREEVEGLLRRAIAAETGVPATLLSGGTEEAMRAAAATMLDWRGTPGQGTPPPPQTAAVPASTVTAGDKLGHAPNAVKQLNLDEFRSLQPAERMAAVRAGQCADLGIGVPKQQRRMGNSLELGASAAQQR